MGMQNPMSFINQSRCLFLQIWPSPSQFDLSKVPFWIRPCAECAPQAPANERTTLQSVISEMRAQLFPVKPRRAMGMLVALIVL